MRPELIVLFAAEIRQMSEALKRRFAFIEILPPSRAQRASEQAIVLYKALKSITYLSEAIKLDNDGTLRWREVVTLTPEATGAGWTLGTPLHAYTRRAVDQNALHNWTITS